MCRTSTSFARKTAPERSRLEAEVAAIALAVLGLLSLVSFFAESGLLKVWREGLGGAFGVGAFLVPPLFGLCGVAVWLEVSPSR